MKGVIRRRFWNSSIKMTVKWFIWKAAPLRDWMIARLTCKKVAFIVWCWSLLPKIALDVNVGTSSKTADYKGIFNDSSISYSDNMICLFNKFWFSDFRTEILCFIHFPPMTVTLWLASGIRSWIWLVQSDWSNPFVFEMGWDEWRPTNNPGCPR
jgi:hypothetical protein